MYVILCKYHKPFFPTIQSTEFPSPPKNNREKGRQTGALSGQVFLIKEVLQLGQVILIFPLPLGTRTRSLHLGHL